VKLRSALSSPLKSSGLVAKIFAAYLGGASLAAQVPMNLPIDHAGIVTLQAAQEKDEMAFRKVPAAKDRGEQLGTLPSFIAQHASFFTTKGGIYNAASEFDTYIEKDHPDTRTLAAKLQPVQSALKAAVPSFYVAMFNTEIARIFLKEEFDLPMAQSLAQSGIALYNHNDCLKDDRYSAESHHVYDESKAKHPVPFTYHLEEGEQHCAQAIASDYAILGKIEAKRGEVDAAASDFQKALHEHPNAAAALGFAVIDKAKGDETGELAMFNIAVLTGAVSPDDVTAARSLYAKLNPGSIPSSYDDVLDKLYAATFVNPVMSKANTLKPGIPPHVVLEELFTGADCEPCVAPDLASEGMLHHYTRNEVVLAVYHDNAPGPDPLTTTVSEKRGDFYGTGGSTPHVFVDGKELEIEEGPPSHAQSSFDIMTRAIDPLLTAASTATLQATAQRTGSLVQVTVNGNVDSMPAKVHLQILLLETSISDTGKNTLRFQPMVVRAAARVTSEELGLTWNQGNSFSKTYTFDLQKVEDDNLAYYDHYREQFEARMAPFISKAYMTKASVDDRAKFREARNQVHPERLVVIAFLQRDDTKNVLQTIYSAVSAPREGEK